MKKIFLILSLTLFALCTTSSEAVTFDKQEKSISFDVGKDLVTVVADTYDFDFSQSVSFFADTVQVKTIVAPQTFAAVQLFQPDQLVFYECKIQKHNYTSLSNQSNITKLRPQRFYNKASLQRASIPKIEYC